MSGFLPKDSRVRAVTGPIAATAANPSNSEALSFPTSDTKLDTPDELVNTIRSGLLFRMRMMVCGSGCAGMVS
jgi:hypothetical protein